MLRRLSICVVLWGCHSKPSKPPVPLEEVHITAGGERPSTSVDAEQLFQQANTRVEQDRCDEALPLYRRIIFEFKTSRFVPVALYNSGLCLEALKKPKDASQQYTQVVDAYPDSRLIKQSMLHLLKTLVEASRWKDAQKAGKRFLSRGDLTPQERIEGGLHLTNAFLGLYDAENAETQARETLKYYKDQNNPPEAKFYAAGTNYGLAEAIRQRSYLIILNDATLEAQQKKLARRAEVLLAAQREYYHTLLFMDKHWTAVSGYRIGNMYDAFWHAMMNAPVPANVAPEGHVVYRNELARMIKPLIRHAIRYWELTKLIIVNNHMEAEWAPQLEQNIERMKAVLRLQPAGPEGIPVQKREARTSAQ